MPIYEYRCPACGSELEVLQKFDDPAPMCECNAEKGTEHAKPMVRKVSRSSFELLGGGWAKDGYGS